MIATIAALYIIAFFTVSWLTFRSMTALIAYAGKYSAMNPDLSMAPSKKDIPNVMIKEPMSERTTSLNIKTRIREKLIIAISISGL